MPSWKKVIISGSNADLLTVTASFKGNLTGTASVATTASYVNPLNQNVIVTGSILATSTITAAQHIEARVNLKSMYQAGDEGGEIFLNTPATNTTINNGVNIDVYQDKLRFWEDGGVNRGFYLDIPSGAPGVGTNLKPTGYTGFFTVPTNPPGQQTLDIQNGIIVNVL